MGSFCGFSRWLYEHTRQTHVGELAVVDVLLWSVFGWVVVFGVVLGCRSWVGFCVGVLWLFWFCVGWGGGVLVWFFGGVVGFGCCAFCVVVCVLSGCLCWVCSFLF